MSLCFAASAPGGPAAAQDAARSAAGDAAAGASVPVVRSVAVEHAEGLAHFHRVLRDLEAGRRRRVRVLHYGDSNVAANLWTRVTRGTLRRRYGDGGTGWLVPPPWGTHVRSAVTIRGGDGWEPRRHGAAGRFGPPDGLWGLAGVGVSGSGRAAALRIELPESGPGVLHVHALAWRRGGRLSLRLDEEEAVELGTRRRRPEVVGRSISIGPGPHRLTIRVTGPRPVRLLGIEVEHDRPGVVYDVLGINGHRASAMLRWDRDVLARSIAARTPDLLVLGYGANEALDPDLSMERYARQLDRSLSLMRALAPEASCLVVSPVAMCGEPRNQEVTAIQRAAAPRHGCAFWNTSEVSGGPDSLCGWIRRGLVHTDRLHLTQAGYELVGERFTQALLPGP